MGIDTHAPILNCNGYTAGLNSCTANFVTCGLASALAGPGWGVVLGLCGVALMYCVDAVDAAYPDCVPPGGSLIQLQQIKQIWLQKESASCD